MKILITGGAGYIGTLLLRRLAAEPSSQEIISIDVLPKPQDLPGEKIFWIQHDLSKNGWQEKVLGKWLPDVIIHLAFNIRSPYGKEMETKENNLGASQKVFEFAFQNNVPKLIYASSVAAYGAKESNVGKLLRETDPLEEKMSPYGVHKRLAEELLQEIAVKLKSKTHVVIVRLNSVTGPYGQSLKSKFGLITFLRKLLPFVIEAHPAWARQFIHEKDVEEIFWKLARSLAKNGAYDIYNAAPPSYLTAKDMAKLLDKKIFKFPKWLVEPVFWIVWNVTRGKIPTHPSSASGLIYPINVNGSKIEEIGFHYRFSSSDALLGKS